MASPLSPNDLTRQQLDELDSLLQRMLSLPLSTPVGGLTAPLSPPPMPDAPSAVSGSWRSDAAAPARSPYFPGDPSMVPLTPALPALAALARSPEAPPATWGPDPLTRHTSHETPRLLAPSQQPPASGPVYQYPLTTGTVRGVDAPALPAGYRDSEKTVAPTPAPPSVPEALSVPTPVISTDSRPIPLPLWPLFGLNWVLEAILGLLGPVGTILTHPAMKHLLGWAGILLVLAAGVWAARGQGLIALPLPW